MYDLPEEIDVCADGPLRITTIAKLTVEKA
jgi:hypothetical protein